MIFHVAIASDRPSMEAEQAKLDRWNRKNAKARMVSSKSISQKILGKLIGALTATTTMWKKLKTLHLKKTSENIFILQACFFNYKMSATDDISSYIQIINEMPLVLVDLGIPISETMLLSKIICSLSLVTIVLLPPGQMFL